MEHRNQSSWIAFSTYNISLLTSKVLGVNTPACSSFPVAANVLHLGELGKLGEFFGWIGLFPDPSSSSAPQPEEEGVLALLAVQGVILVIKIQNVLLGLKSKLLVEQHSRVACRDVKGDVLAHAGLQREGERKKKEISLQENETASGGMRR